MSTTIDLGKGETAILKSDSDLTNKQMKELKRAARAAAGVALRLKEYGFDQEKPETWDATLAAHLTDDDDDLMDLYQRTAIFLRLDSWTLDRDLPESPEEVDDLPRQVYAALAVPAAKINWGDDFGVSVDPKAPTDSSDDSSMSSSDEPS